MIAISLQSGSSGNCIYVETNGVKLLFDAGICGSHAETRLKAAGRNIRELDGVLISHDHSDHMNYAGVYQRKYGLPLYFTPKTLHKGETGGRLGKLTDVRYFLAGGEIRFGEISVQTIPTPHDAVDGVAFVISNGEKRLGILTDLGHAFPELFPVVASLDAVFLESNHDVNMLENGRYPAFLQKRIRGPKGHISNRESAELLQSGRKLKWACLSHLSECNNTPGRALKTHREIIGSALPLHVAGRYAPTPVLKV